ncbi:hypothetical protein PMAYCL1PPCAC_18132, partial [Pristionchus mayeri]
RMLLSRVVGLPSRRSASSAIPSAIAGFVADLASSRAIERSVEKSSVELEKLIDEEKATAIDRINYIKKLPTQVNKQQLNRIRKSSFASEFSSTTFKNDDTIVAIDKLCKLKATDTEGYRTLMSNLSSICPSNLRTASVCSLVEVVSTNEESKVIDNDEWRSESRKIVAELITHSEIPTQILYALKRSNLWKDECFQAIDGQFTNMNFTDKVSLLNALSGRKDVEDSFLNRMVEDIARDATPLTFRQCVNLATTCIDLKLKSSRLKEKLIEETKAAMGSMEKWNDARTIVTLFTIWRVTDDQVWKLLSKWTARKAEDELKTPFKDLAAVVYMMADLGRSEGAETASILSKRMCREKGGDAVNWLSTIMSLSFYSCVDHEYIENVLGTAFIEDALAQAPMKKALVLRLLMQVDYYASTLPSYTGPRLRDHENLITDKDRASILSSYYPASKKSDVDSFRSCLPRVIVDPSHRSPSVHPSGITVEALFTNANGEEEAVVYVPSDRCARDKNGERMMGSIIFSLHCMLKMGVKVHLFTQDEMSAFNSHVEATAYIKKKILGVESK